MDVLDPASFLHFGELGFAALTMLTAFWYMGSAFTKQTNSQTESIVASLHDVKASVDSADDKASARHEQLLMALSPQVFGRPQTQPSQQWWKSAGAAMPGIAAQVESNVIQMNQPKGDK